MVNTSMAEKPCRTGALWGSSYSSADVGQELALRLVAVCDRVNARTRSCSANPMAGADDVELGGTRRMEESTCVTVAPEDVDGSVGAELGGSCTEAGAEDLAFFASGSIALA